MKNHPTLRYFAYAHLPAHLQAISKPFHDLAFSMVDQVMTTENIAEVCDPGSQLSLGLQKLVEAKDCMVRAALPSAAEGKNDGQV